MALINKILSSGDSSGYPLDVDFLRVLYYSLQ